VLGLAVSHPENRTESLGDPFVMGLASTAFDLLADLGLQCQNHHSPQNDKTAESTSEDDGEHSGDYRTFSFAEAIQSIANSSGTL
jgi:hypothetical protein